MKYILKVIFVVTACLAQAICNAQLNSDSLLQGFQRPPLTARPKALWPWVNGNFNYAAITREMEEAKAKGMGGFDIWDVGTMINSDNIVPGGPSFLGDESLAAIAHAIREGNRLNLELGLITSSSWNAGGTWVKPQHGAMGLFRSDTVIQGPIEFKGQLPFPKIPEIYDGRKTLVQRDANGLPVFYKEVALLLHPLKKDSTLSENDIRVLAPSPTELISVPQGTYRLVRYVCAPTGQPLMIPSPKSNGLMLDHFSAEAQEENMKYILGRLKEKFPSLKDLSLKYLYEDSYEVNTAVWTPLLPDAFFEHHGYKIEKYLPVLDGFTLKNKDITARFIFDFNKTLSNMIIANHYAKGREISEKEGLGFYAEAGGPGQPIHNVPFEDLKALGALTVPRGEFWNNHDQLELLQIVKGIASASHIYNQRYVEAEAFTSVWLWQEGPDALKPLADRAMCEGLNRFVYHTFPHTTPEAGSPGWIYNFGTIINTTNGWWPKSNTFHEYLARCSYLLQQGNFVGDVAFYYGDAAPNFVPPKHIPSTLGKGYDYDVVNTDILLGKLSVKNGKLVLPHGQTYEVLVLPDDERINPDVLLKIEKLIQDGATVIGRKPARSYSLADHEKTDQLVSEVANRMWGKLKGAGRSYGKGHIIWKKTARQVLMERGVTPDVTFTSKVTHDSCDFIHRRTATEDIYFIRNKSKKKFEGTVAFRVSNATAEWWNPLNGKSRRITNFTTQNNSTTIPIQLRGHESAFIVFKTNNASANTSNKNDVVNTSYGEVRTSVEPRQKTISGPWTVLLEHRPGVPTSISMNELSSLHTAQVNNVKHFTGLATYQTNFDFSAKEVQRSKTVLLQLNKVREIADVYLNGEKLGTHWYDGTVFDITQKLKSGRNHLIIEVVNTINNGLIGDAQKPEEYRVYKSNVQKLPNAWMKPFKEAPLLPGGLLGPVVLTFGE